MGRHSHWRDCQAWRDEGLEMSSTSNEAVKLFDASLTQMVGWYEESSVGGFVKGVSDMLASDNTFVMGHVLKNAVRVISHENTMASLDPEAQSNLEVLYSVAEGANINPREKMHVEAVKLFAEEATYFFLSCLMVLVYTHFSKPQEGLNKLEDLLLDYPTDMLAIKVCELGYFNVGNLTQQRDFKYRVFPHWNPSTPLYSHLFGMIAYGEMETGMFEKAEKNAHKALEMNPLDGWAVHALAHVLNDTGRYDEGIQHLSSTIQDWPDGKLAWHNRWHLGLYYIERGDIDAGLHYFDSQLEDGTRESDKASFLYRLEMEGVDVGDRWSAVYEKLRPHLDDAFSGMYDFHCVMACLGAKHRQDAQEMINGMQETIKTGSKKTAYWQVAKKVGANLCEAVLAYDDQDYARAVDLLMPVRYDIRLVGGSNAQRDVLAQLLIHSAIQSPDKKHQKLARNLINERRAHNDTPMVDRLMRKLLSNHDD